MNTIHRDLQVTKLYLSLANSMYELVSFDDGWKGMDRDDLMCMAETFIARALGLTDR